MAQTVVPSKSLAHHARKGLSRIISLGSPFPTPNPTSKGPALPSPKSRPPEGPPDFVALQLVLYQGVLRTAEVHSESPLKCDS